MIFQSLHRDFLKAHIGDFISLIEGWKFSDWKEDNFLYELPRKWEFSFAAYDADTLIGFCIASNKIKDVFYIHLIYVDEKARGMNLGRKMLQHAKSIALQNNISKIELRCPETNADAAGFYRHTGFIETALLKDDVSGDVADHYFQLQLK
jgi:ribosomal protein S18 acetylase RimI-like enzyme